MDIVRSVAGVPIRLTNERWDHVVFTCLNRSSKLAVMLPFVLRRFYLSLIGMLLFTLPMFAATRVDYARSYPLCASPPGAVAMRLRCSDVIDGAFPALPRDGQFYAIWQRGIPLYDYWPLALVLLAAGCVVQLVSLIRDSRRSAKMGDGQPVLPAEWGIFHRQL